VRRENRVFLTLAFIGKWTQWYRLLRYRKGFGRFDSVRHGLWLAGAEGGILVARTEALNGRSHLRTNFANTPGSGSLLEVDAWIPSEAKAISPLVDRLMRLIEGSHCITGEEHAVELALREALSNAVVHGNRLEAHKLVHVRCRCKVGKGISLIVSDQGQGFDAHAIPDLGAVDNLGVEHGRGIRLMKSTMDEVSFQQGGTEVRMCKKLARNPRVGPQSDSGGS